MTTAFATGWFDAALGAGGRPPDGGALASSPPAPSVVSPGPIAGASGLTPGDARITDPLESKGPTAHLSERRSGHLTEGV